MLGLADIWVSLAFYALFIGAAVCVIYGALNWNHGEAEEDELREEALWAEEEREIEDAL